MRGKIDEITGVEVSTLNQSQKTKVSFGRLYEKDFQILRYEPLQDRIVEDHLDFMSSFNSRCRQVCNGGSSYNCDFFYITLRVDNRYWKDVNEFSHMSHMEDISRKFVRRINYGLGVKREDKVGNKNRHYVAHASTFIENRDKRGRLTDARGSKVYHHAHIVLALYHSKSKKLNEQLIRQALDGSFVGDEFGEAKKLSEVLQSVKVQPINIGSRYKRYNELKRVIHYSAKNCGSGDDEFRHFKNVKKTTKEHENVRLDRLLGISNRGVQGTRTIDASGIRV